MVTIDKYLQIYFLFKPFCSTIYYLQINKLIMVFFINIIDDLNIYFLSLTRLKGALPFSRHCVPWRNSTLRFAEFPRVGNEPTND